MGQSLGRRCMAFCLGSVDRTTSTLHQRLFVGQHRAAAVKASPGQYAECLEQEGDIRPVPVALRRPLMFEANGCRVSSTIVASCEEWSDGYRGLAGRSAGPSEPAGDW